MGVKTLRVMAILTPNLSEIIRTCPGHYMARSRSPDIRAREAAPDKIGMRTLGAPEEFDSTPLDRKNEVRTPLMRAG